MSFAYGVMGLSPEEFAGITPFQFELKCKGFKDGQSRIETNFRKLGWITFAVNADPKAAKGMTIDSVWPIAGQVVKKQGFDKKKVNSMIAKFIKMNPNKTLK
jgi:hypothetical protein